LLELVSIDASAATAALNGGEGPDFYAANTSPSAGGAGGTVGCVISLQPEWEVIPVNPGEKVHTETLTYKSAVAFSQGDPEQDVTLANAHEELGDPPVASVIVVLSDGILLAEDGMATITLYFDEAPPPRRQFRRGDANNDALVNIADTVWVLSYLFRDGLEPPCLDAADANDDGTLDPSDALLIVNYRLRKGIPPSAPFPDCGSDPSDTDSDNPEDGLTCAAHGAGCPQ
jgi:hypothetical protein